MRRPDYEAVAKLDRRLARERPVDYRRNFRAFDDLFEHARHLGVWATGDRLKDIEIEIRYAQAINARGAAR